MTSVLVIGAGIGGIAVAGRLARRGYDVTVLEKNVAPGGRLNKLLQDGHRFDVGPSLFLDGLGIVAPYQLKDAIAFTMLVMVLIFRPTGILGERLAVKKA